MKGPLTIISLVLSLSLCGQIQITTGEINALIGHWEGSLTYLDYQSGEPYTMPANVTITAGKNARVVVLNNSYPNEPQANNKGKLVISKDGLYLNKHEITSRKTLDNGDLQFQTVHRGKDDRKKATICHTYILGRKSFSMKKEVRFDESETWIKRNEFFYSRKT